LLLLLLLLLLLSHLLSLLELQYLHDLLLSQKELRPLRGIAL